MEINSKMLFFKLLTGVFSLSPLEWVRMKVNYGTNRLRAAVVAAISNRSVVLALLLPLEGAVQQFQTPAGDSSPQSASAPAASAVKKREM